MAVSRLDLAAALELRQWVDGRSRARKRARVVAASFGRTRGKNAVTSRQWLIGRNVRGRAARALAVVTGRGQ